MKKRSYLAGSIGQGTMMGLAIGLLMAVLMTLTTGWIRVEVPAMEIKTLFPVMLMLGGSLWMAIGNYSFYFSEMSAMLAMGATRKETFLYHLARLLIVTTLLGGIIWIVQALLAGEIQLLFPVTAAMMILFSGAVGNLLGCLQFRLGKAGFVFFLILCMGIGGVYGALSAAIQKGRMAGIFEAVMESGAMAWAAVTALILSAAVTVLLMRKAEARI